MAEELKVRISVDTQQAEGSLRGFKSMLGGLGDVLKTGVGFAVGGILQSGLASVTDGLKSFITSAQEAELGQAALNAVIKSTGGAAGVTAQMANELASGFQKTTMFSDDATLAGENLLLTFTNIGKDVFPMATEAMLNLSQAMGTDPKQAAIQLGKALNDPIAGISALSRVGVSFTEQQKEQIKAMTDAGDVMGAQKLILAELEKEFGGAAEAAGNTFAGKMAILNNQFDDVKETIGGAFLPLLTQVGDTLSKIFADPAVQAGIQSFATNLAAGLAQVGTLIAGALPAVQQFFGMIQGLFAGGGGGNGFTQWLGELGGAINAAVGPIMDALTPALAALQPILDQIGAVVGPVIALGLKAMGDAIVKDIIPHIGTMIAQFLLSIPPFVEFAKVVGGQVNVAIANLKDIWGKVVQGFQDAGGFIENTKAKLADIAGAINTVIGPALQAFNDSILKPIVDTFNSMVNAVKGVVDWLNELARILGVDVGKGFMDLLHQIGIPGFAEGTMFAPGGFAMVGEHGPELVNLPRGAQVFPAGAWGGGAGTVNVYLTYAPVVSLMDQSEAQEKLAPFLRAALAAV